MPARKHQGQPPICYKEARVALIARYYCIAGCPSLGYCMYFGTGCLMFENDVPDERDSEIHFCAS
ncbi:MAG: hypothetical protein AAB071_02665 [Bacteroidota bacterium]